ncbi:LexA family protein [Methylobacterium iners]|uniref:LexA repressor n=1 Tax=Methylobacterium iners TaxID=418707 RepID=A0ABQ4RUP0_9HYPH|nr:helix-turn-helix domain-containing protein [Methylobacterium iners]GJD93393.1 LexA repressor [Methylobacterium iners]
MNAQTAFRPKLNLTIRQRQLLDFISARVAAGLEAPSYTEMADHLGVASKSNIHRLVQGLIERGYLHEMPANRKRALTLVSESASAAMAAPTSAPALPPQAGLVRIQNVDAATGTATLDYAVKLPTALALELLEHCQSRQEAPNEIVITAIVRHLRRQP